LRIVDCTSTGQRLDTAYACGDAAFTRDHEIADVARGLDVCSAAQLEAETRYRHHTDAIAVLLPEERHGPGRNRFLGRAHLGLHRDVAPDLLVDDAFDLEHLRRSDWREVCEVETQPIGCYQRARLLDVAAEHLPQRRVQEVRRRVIPPGRIADV